MHKEPTGTFFTTAATVAFLRGDWRRTVDYAQQGVKTARTTEDAYNETTSGEISSMRI